MKPILWEGFQFAASFVFDFGHPQRDGTGWKSHPLLRDSSSQRGCEIVYAFSKDSISHPFWDIPSGMDFNLRMKWWFYFPSRFFKYIRHPLGWANGMENRRCRKKYTDKYVLRVCHFPLERPFSFSLNDLKKNIFCAFHDE